MGNKNRKKMGPVDAAVLAAINPAVGVSVELKDEVTGKMVASLVPQALADEAIGIWQAAADQYYGPGGIKEHTEALERINASPDALGNRFLKFGQQIIEAAQHDAKRALSWFEGACKLAESTAKSVAIEGGMDVKQATVAKLLPTWQSNKATILGAMKKAAEKSKAAGQFDLTATVTNNTTHETAPLYRGITDVRKALVASRGSSDRNEGSILKGVATMSPRLKTVIEALAKSLGKMSVAQQDEAAEILAEAQLEVDALHSNERKQTGMEAARSAAAAAGTPAGDAARGGTRAA